LWFLAYLFTFSLLYLPYFAKVNARTEAPVVTKRTLITFTGLLVAVNVLLRWAWPGFQDLVWDWANFAFYSLFFIAGFYLGRFPSVEQLVDANYAVAGCIGLVAALAQIPYNLRLVTLSSAADWKAYLWIMPLQAIAGVGLVIGVLGWARRHFNGEGRLHRWTRDNAFGVYLVHQICVVACATLVIRTSWPIASKFAVTLLSATVVTVALNEMLRRIDWLAPAFGRDRKPKGVTPLGGSSAPRSVRTPG
jgi:hypothetical protein